MYYFQDVLFKFNKFGYHSLVYFLISIDVKTYGIYCMIMLLKMSQMSKRTNRNHDKCMIMAPCIRWHALSCGIILILWYTYYSHKKILYTRRYRCRYIHYIIRAMSSILAWVRVTFIDIFDDCRKNGTTGRANISHNIIAPVFDIYCINVLKLCAHISIKA